MVSKLWGAKVLPAVCPAVLLVLLLLLVVVAWLEGCLWVGWACGCLDHRQPMLLPLLVVLPAAGRLSAVVLGAGKLLLLPLLPASLLPLLPESLLLLVPGCFNRHMLPEDAAAWLLPALLLALLLPLLLVLLGGGCGSSTACGCCPGPATMYWASARKNLQVRSGCAYCSFIWSKYLHWACCSMLVLTSVRVRDVILLYRKCERLRPVPADSSNTLPCTQRRSQPCVCFVTAERQYRQLLSLYDATHTHLCLPHQPPAQHPVPHAGLLPAHDVIVHAC